MSRPITIHSDGTGRGTIVLDEDGKKIDNISGVTIYINALGVVEATLEVARAGVVTKAEVTNVIFNCPACGDSVDHQCDEVIGGEYTLSGQRL